MAHKDQKPERLPETKNALVLRTDFSDEQAWKSVCVEIEKPQTEDNFQAFVEFVGDPEYDGVTVEKLLALSPKGSGRSYMFVVDKMALTHADRPILVIDLLREFGRTFRVIPSQMWAVENNLSIANMDFREFADNVDPDGIFRDFK